jgi:hypothetical protein
MGTVLVASPQEAARLFGWEAWRLERSVKRLADSGALVADLRVGDRNGLLGLARLIRGLQL